jgi:hypothetical protein
MCVCVRVRVSVCSCKIPSLLHSTELQTRILIHVIMLSSASMFAGMRIFVGEHVRNVCVCVCVYTTAVGV